MDIELYGLINSKLKGKASLVNGKVPADQLPSYVDDVINGYYDSVTDKFYEEDTYETEIPAEEGKIYVDLTTNSTYRWSGIAYVQVGPTGPVVIANPTLAGDEPDLESLQVGNQKYKVGGGHLYLHLINIYMNDWNNTGSGYDFKYNGNITINIINNNSNNILNLTDLYNNLPIFNDENYLTEGTFNGIIANGIISKKTYADGTFLISVRNLHRSNNAAYNNKILFSFTEVVKQDALLTTWNSNKDAIDINNSSSTGTLRIYDKVIQIL